MSAIQKFISVTSAVVLLPAFALAASEQQARQGQKQQESQSSQREVAKLKEELKPGQERQFYLDKVKESKFEIGRTVHTIEKEGQAYEVELEVDKETDKVASVRIREVSQGPIFSDRYQEQRLVKEATDLPLEDSKMFKQELEKRGYKVTRQEQKNGSIEIDAVKHGRLLTVTVDVDKETGRARNIQASDLRWESDEARSSLMGVGREEWSSGKEELEQALQTGKPRDFYRKALEDLGYMITAVNYDQPDYLEYEVVKGQNSYEVKLDFEREGSSAASEVEIAGNWWKSTRTKQALKRADEQQQRMKQ